SGRPNAHIPYDPATILRPGVRAARTRIQIAAALPPAGASIGALPCSSDTGAKLFESVHLMATARVTTAAATLNSVTARAVATAAGPSCGACAGATDTCARWLRSRFNGFDIS